MATTPEHGWSVTSVTDSRGAGDGISTESRSHRGRRRERRSHNGMDRGLAGEAARSRHGTRRRGCLLRRSGRRVERRDRWVVALSWSERNRHRGLHHRRRLPSRVHGRAPGRLVDPGRRLHGQRGRRHRARDERLGRVHRPAAPVPVARNRAGRGLDGRRARRGSRVPATAQSHRAGADHPRRLRWRIPAAVGAE
jgi:hypothetical protein